MDTNNSYVTYPTNTILAAADETLLYIENLRSAEWKEGFTHYCQAKHRSWWWRLFWMDLETSATNVEEFKKLVKGNFNSQYARNLWSHCMWEEDVSDIIRACTQALDNGREECIMSFEDLKTISKGLTALKKKGTNNE